MYGISMQCLNLKKKGKTNSKDTNSLKPLTNVTDQFWNLLIGIINNRMFMAYSLYQRPRYTHL